MGAFVAGLVQQRNAERTHQLHQRQMELTGMLHEAQAKHLNAQTKQIQTFYDMMAKMNQPTPGSPIKEEGPQPTITRQAPMQGPGRPEMTPLGEQVMGDLNSGLTPPNANVAREFTERAAPLYQEGPQPAPGMETVPVQGPGGPIVTGQEPPGSSPLDTMLQSIPPERRAMVASLIQAAPEKVIPLLMEHLIPGKKELLNLGPGHQAIDPLTGTVLAENPPLDKPEKSPLTVSDENRVAMEMFNTPYTELSQEQKTGVNKRMKEDKLELAREYAKGRVQEGMEQPLPPTEAGQLGVPYGTTKKGAAAQQLASITPHQRETLQSFDQARNIVADIEKYYKNIPHPEPGFISRYWGSMQNYLSALAQTDPNAAALLSKSGELSMLIRAMGERGALANQDVGRGVMLIPGLGDIATVGNNKLKDLKTFFDGGESAFMKSLQPIPQKAIVQKKRELSQLEPAQEKPNKMSAEEADYLAKRKADYEKKKQPNGR